MTPLELAFSAAKAMEDPGTLGLVLSIQKGKYPRGFPRGELLNEIDRDGIVTRTYHFKPDRVLAWLVNHGLVVMERSGERTLKIRDPHQGGKPSA